MTSSTTDIIDLLAGIGDGSAVDRIRKHRPETRANAQKSYLALFEPVQEGDVPISERLAIAAFVAGLHGADHVAEFYFADLSETAGGASLAGAVKAEVRRGRTSGPYGAYPDGPLSSENTSGLVLQVSEFDRVLLGAKLTTGLEHAHLLVFRPREASAGALQKLIDAGWTATGIVTLSQIVAFLSFQIRVVAGLSALQADADSANDLASNAAE